MTVIRKIHSKPYRKRNDIQARLDDLNLLIASIRDLPIQLDIKKRMLNHALWEITKVLGNYSPEFRSEGVLNGSTDSNTKIERDHVFGRKQLVEDILANAEPLQKVLLRVVHCVVTKEEHDRLTRLPKGLDGWERYYAADVVVFNLSGDHPKKHSFLVHNATPKTSS